MNKSSYQFVLFLAKYSFLTIVFLPLAPLQQVAADYTIDVPYQEAVPDFLEAITDATDDVKDVQELDDIAQWAEESRSRLPEFLDDLIEIAKQLEDNGSPEFILEKYTAFVDKWEQVAETYPGLSELEPVLDPILDQLLAGLPTLEPIYGENPTTNLYDLYQEMVQLDPWGIGSFWYIPPVENSFKETKVSEKFLERTIQGYQSITIVERDVVVTRNGVVVFSELIRDDELISKQIVYRDPSILHETLDEMVRKGEDPELIEVVEELVGMVDLNLDSGLENGILDECSYSFIYRKVLAGAIDTCVDINGHVRDFAEMSEYSPFDDVNQVELGRSKFLSGYSYTGSVSVPPPMPSLMSDTASMENMAGAWMVGVMAPAYVWSLIGAARLF